MPPARKKTTTRRAPAKKTAPPPPQPATGPLIGTLCGEEIEVRPVDQWRKSAMTALRTGDLDTWAEQALTDDGFDVWDELDPTFAEIGEFFASFGDEMAAHDMQVPGAPRANRSQRRAASRR